MESNDGKNDADESIEVEYCHCGEQENGQRDDQDSQEELLDGELVCVVAIPHDVELCASEKTEEGLAHV